MNRTRGLRLMWGFCSGCRDVDVEDDLKPGNHELESAKIDGVGVENLLLDDLDHQHPQPAFGLEDSLQQYYPDIQQIDSQSASLDLNNMQFYDYDLTTLDPRLNYSSASASKSYVPYLGMDTLTNEVLLSMVQNWQDLVDEGGVPHALNHPQFLELMGELVERGVISVDWKWNVNVEEVDLGFVRVVVGGWGNRCDRELEC